MIRCPKCGLAARRAGVSVQAGVVKESFVCPNPRCANYKNVFIEKEMEGESEDE